MNKLLIVKLSALGDVVHTFAFVNALKRARPEMAVDWLVNDLYAGLVKCHPGVNRVWHFRRAAWGKSWNSPSTVAEIVSLLSWIRKERYDLCLDLQGLLRSGLFTCFSGAERTAGFANAREGSRFLYGTKIAPGPKPHAVDILMQTLSLFGAPPPQTPDFSFNVPEQSEALVKSLLRRLGVGGHYLVFHPGARWETKQWSAKQWSALAVAITKKSGLPVVFTGSAGDSAMINSIIAGRTGMFNLAGELGLVETSALLKHCAVMATVDSGPMHIAAAFNRPIAALFGPTSPAKTGPLTQAPCEIVQLGDMDCVPCLKRQCKRNHECMERITPEEVEFRVMRILGFLRL
ncbi:MAG: glycosyltransferase family 9 protein [Nitrospinae bacterium]|nr:glycosyltransferase family 9 protein [Nitrospinota bacterium]